MAWIIMEAQQRMYEGRQQHDCLCESTDDLGAEVAAGYASFNGSHVFLAKGSMAYCLGDGKLYVKKSDGTWGEAAE